MNRKSTPSEHYALTREPAPMPRPRWWQSRWGIVDRRTSDQAVVEWFWHFGACENRVNCLNGQASPVMCQNSAADRSHNERLALAS